MNLFVKSKSGEIDRRIDDCEKIVDALAEQEENHEDSGFNTRARQSRLFRLHQEINKLSRDIQSLARFVGVQRTGFRKLLKKYKKWSGSGKLDKKFKPILEAQDSFVFEDFTSKFLELSLLYEVLRQAKFTSVRQQTPVDISHNSLTKFDCDLVTSITNHAIFWIHPDNFVELQVFLLKGLSLYQTEVPKLRNVHSQLQLTRHSSTNNISSLSKPASSVAPGSVDDQGLNPVYTRVLFLDGPNFRYAHSGKEPGQVHYVDEEEQSVGYVFCAPVGGLRHFTAMNLNSEQFEMIQHGQAKSIEDNDNNSRLALGWINKTNAAPVSEEYCKRTRFISAPDDKAGTIWAALDRGIVLQDRRRPDGEVSEFPYSVLDIRWTHNSTPAIIHELQRSHLVYEMPGFSTYAHSVALFNQEALQNKPSWIHLLEDETDIRKTPVARPSLSKRASAHSLRRGSQRLSASAASEPEPYNHGILLNDKTNRRHHHVSHMSSGSTTSLLTSDDGQTTEAVSPHSQIMTNLPSDKAFGRGRNTNTQRGGNKLEFRYWNEFDNPEEGDDFGAFLINEEDHDGFFSDSNVDAIVDFSSKLFHKLGKIKNVFAFEKQGERSPLLSGDEDEDADDNIPEVGSRSPRFQPRNSRYSTATYDTDINEDDYQYDVVEKRDRVLTAIYSACFVFSVLTTAILFGVILGEDMTQVTIATFAFTIIGLMFALGIGILGMCFYMLREAPGWAHQTLVFTSFFSIVCFTVGGICWILS